MFQPIRKLFKSLKFNYLSLFLIGLSTIILFSFMYGSVKKETYELKSFQIAPDTIRSLKTVEDTVTVVLQVNGKIRDKLEVPTGLSREELEKFATSSERVQKHIGDLQVKKMIVVPNKLVNIVAG